MFDYFFFDLDGTLTDPGTGITNAIIYSLKKMKIDVPKREELYKFIGPPLRSSYKKYYGLSDEEAENAVTFYREHYSVKGMYENEVYKDIPFVLETLKKNKKKIVMATSKPEIFAFEILKYFDLYKYFDGTYGATMDDYRVTKTDVIRYAISDMDIKDKRSVIMIGDRDNDIIGAKENGISSAGVLYGYGTEKELKDANPDYLLKTAMDIISLQH